jgi:NitT/TauT family transport system permease protein
MTARLLGALRPLVALALLLALWQLAAILLRESYLPPPSAILPEVERLIVSGELTPHILSSLSRLAWGFAIGVAIGIPLGLVSGRSERVDEFVAPLLALFYPIPKAALMPIFLLWFGAGDLSKIAIIVLSVTLPLVYHAHQGAKSVDEKLLWSAAAMGTSRTRQLWTVILPASLPEVLLGARVAIVIGVIVMVSSEMIVRQSGVGYYIFNALDMAEYQLTYAVIVVVAALGYALDWLFEGLRRRLTFWAPERRDIGAPA